MRRSFLPTRGRGVTSSLFVITWYLLCHFGHVGEVCSSGTTAAAGLSCGSSVRTLAAGAFLFLTLELSEISAVEGGVGAMGWVEKNATALGLIQVVIVTSSEGENAYIIEIGSRN
ncbi:hypothetical protein V6N13_072931 [Hibiscus sabdariffa]